MPNVVTVLKAEISRLAKKEAKVATSKLKRASVQYRSDIAKLRKQIGQQAKAIALLKKRTQEGQPQAAEEALETNRFSARSVKAQRRRLGLSAEKYAKLVGVSALTIYSWESGKNKPRKAQFEALVGVRGIGKREAIQRLEEMKARRGRRKRK
jgi:DNA-binding transcriptional regulator YiaG